MGNSGCKRQRNGMQSIGVACDFGILVHRWRRFISGFIFITRQRWSWRLVAQVSDYQVWIGVAVVQEESRNAEWNKVQQRKGEVAKGIVLWRVCYSDSLVQFVSWLTRPQIRQIHHPFTTDNYDESDGK